ncbi:MAG: MFS transporter [Deltaproteobacteria bacterium]
MTRVKQVLGLTRKNIPRPCSQQAWLSSFLCSFIIPCFFVVFLGGVGFFLYSLRPVLIAWAMELAPKELGGSVVGLQFSFQSGLSALAPVLGGWIADHWGLMATFYFLAATVILSNVLVVFIRESARSVDKSAD